MGWEARLLLSDRLCSAWSLCRVLHQAASCVRLQAKEALKHPYFDDPYMKEVDQLENPEVRARD